MRKALVLLALLVLFPVVVEATCLLQFNTSPTIVLGPFVNDTDGKTAETALTIAQADVRLSKNGAAFAQKNETTSCTHMENGYYSCPFNTTDTGTGGQLTVAVSEAGALPVWRTCLVLASSAYDALQGAGNGLRANMIQWNSTAVATPDTAGYPVVTVKDGTGAGEINTATGRVGINWGDVGNQSTSVSLSATTVNAVTSLTGNVPANVSNSGTAQAGGASTLTLATSASTTGDFYKDQVLHLTGGTGAGQSCRISTYSVGRVATCSAAWATTPDGTTTYTVVADGPVSATVSGNVTVGAYDTGQSPADLVLVTPANKLVTDASGRTQVQAGTGTGQVDLSSGRVKDDKPSVGRLALKKGTTSYLTAVYIEDQRTGGPLTGLAFNTASLTMYHTRADQGDANASQCTLASATRGSFTSSGSNNCGFIEKDATNAPGWYELSVANNIIATGSSWATITLKGAANMKPATLFIELVDSNTSDIATLIGTPSVSVAADIATRLAPTVAGRTLDVTAGGTAGIDWANVEAPTTAVDLSGTTIATSQAVASVSGAVGSVTGNVGGNVAGSVGSVTGNVGGNVNGNVGGNVTGSVGSVAAGGITDASFAADAITGDKIAADVATELASVAQGTFRKNVASQRRMPIFMRDASSVQAGLAGATVTVTVSKDGAAAGATTGSVAEISNGMYVFVPSQADTNCDSCFYRATAVGGVDFTWGIYTTP